MMKFGLKWGGAALLAMLFLNTSCGDADLFDTDKWSDKIEGWEPGVSLKVVHGSFTLWDLINQGDDEVIVKEGNDLIIQYTKEDIYHIGINEVFNMPAENLEFKCEYSVPDMLPGSQLTLPAPLAFGLEVAADLQKIPEGCELKKIEASAVFVLPELAYPYIIRAEFPQIEKDGAVLTIDTTVEANSSKEVELGDFVLTLDADKTVNLKLHVEIQAGAEIVEPELNLVFGLRNFQFKKVEGKIMVDPITIDRGSFNMNVDFLDEIGGKFKFAEPQLNIILRNKGVGVPLSVDAAFSGQNAEEDRLTLKLNTGETLMTSGNNLNQVIPDTLGLNAGNSNIVDFLSLPPSGDIYYEGSVTVNPEGREDNVIYSDAEVDLDAYVRIPFKLSAEGLSYKDTLNDIDIDQKYADKVKEGVITITAVNGLPLNLQIPTLVLMDENGEELERLSAVEGHDIIKAANGNEKSVLEFKLTEEQAKKLGQTDRILLEVNAHTTDNQVVTVTADAQLSFDLKIVAKAVITDIDDF